VVYIPILSKAIAMSIRPWANFPHTRAHSVQGFPGPATFWKLFFVFRNF